MRDVGGQVVKIGAGPLKEFQVFWIGLAMLALFLLRPLLAQAAPCNSHQVSQILFSTSDIKSQSSQLQQWIEGCRDSRHVEGYHPLKVIQDLGNVRYDYRQDSRISRVSIQISNGVQIRGLLGLKPGQRLPLIVVRCGVFCNAANGPVATLAFMHLFEESPFHVLLLGSASGEEFARDNGYIFVSGVEEGAQTIEVIEEFRRSKKFETYFSDIHLMGMSLGGHGTLYASRYAYIRPDLGIRSAMAVCSIVDLRSQMEAAQNIRPVGQYFEKMVQQTFARLYDSVPGLRRILGHPDQWTTEMLPTIISSGSRQILNSRPTSANRFISINMKSDRQYWESNRFDRLANVRGIPTLVLHSLDDEVVPYNESFTNLKRGQDLGVISTLQGSHCAFSLTHGWNTISELMRSFYMSHGSGR